MAETKPGWEWKRAPGHASQPRVEWWVEQVMAMVITKIAKRAHRRGDTATFNRMFAIVCAGSKAEDAEAERENA